MRQRGLLGRNCCPEAGCPVTTEPIPFLEDFTNPSSRWVDDQGGDGSAYFNNDRLEPPSVNRETWVRIVTGQPSYPSQVTLDFNFSAISGGQRIYFVSGDESSFAQISLALDVTLGNPIAALYLQAQSVLIGGFAIGPSQAARLEVNLDTITRLVTSVTGTVGSNSQTLNASNLAIPDPCDLPLKIRFTIQNPGNWVDDVQVTT